MSITSDLLEKNIVKQKVNLTNQFGYNIGINEKNSLEKISKLNEFIRNDIFVIKKR